MRRKSRSDRSRKRLPSARESRIKKRSLKHPKLFPQTLKAKSPFYIKRLRFVTPKPRIIVGPKFYHPNVPNDLLYEYKQNVFGVKHQMRLHSRVNLNIPIPLVTGVPKMVELEEEDHEHREDMLDEDEEDEDEDEENVKGTKKNGSKKKSLLNDDDMVLLGERVNRKEKKLYKTTYSWLRKTEYISSQKIGDSGFDTMGRGDMKRKGKLFRVEESFQKGSEEIINHPTKKGVKLVDEYNIIPDFDTWQNDYVQVHFDREFKPDEGMLVRPEEEKSEKELKFYEKDYAEDNKFTFKKRFTVDKFNENVHFITLNEEDKTARINPLSQYYIMKKNPYQSKNNPPLLIRDREKNDDENEYIKMKMSQLGMEQGE